MYSVRTRDAQWQWARTSLSGLFLKKNHFIQNTLVKFSIGQIRTGVEIKSQQNAFMTRLIILILALVTSFRSKLEVKAYGARLAQSVEHETLNLRVVGSSPTLGDGTLL